MAAHHHDENDNNFVVDASFTTVDDEDEDEDDSHNWSTLLDLALERDPSFAEVRMPFIDPLGNNFIECKPHLVVRLHDVSYTIGTPHDHTVGLLGEAGSGDEDENVEKKLRLLDDTNTPAGLLDDVFKIASMHISAMSNDELKLRRTPATLTIEGDLERYVQQGWEEQKQKEQAFDSIPNNNNNNGDVADSQGDDNVSNNLNQFMEQLSDLDGHDDEDAFLEHTFRKYLGDEYVELDDVNDQPVDEDILRLFDNGLSGSVDDDDGYQEQQLVNVMKELFGNDADADEEDRDDGIPDTMDNDPDDQVNSEKRRKDAYAERLYSFGYEGKLYSLVKMTQPAVIVGREDRDVESRRVLLTPQESLLILPQLKELVQQELADAFLSP